MKNKRKTTMNDVFSLIKSCCNFVKPRECLGVDRFSFPNLPPQNRLECCSILSNHRCLFFEKVILPLADIKSPNQTTYEKARDAYVSLHDFIKIRHSKYTSDGPQTFKSIKKLREYIKKVDETSDEVKNIRTCPGCNKKPLMKYQRYCKKCAIKRANKSKKQYCHNIKKGKCNE